MRRVLCVWFPNWTIQRWWQQEPKLRSGALVVSAEVRGRGLRVAACCSRASGQGVSPGFPLAEARALLQRSVHDRAPQAGLPVWKKADAETDLHALRQVALDCQRFTPLVGLDDSDHPESLLLDIAGCAPLFGDERNLLAELSQFLTERGFQIRTALADTIGAAWAGAHAGSSGTIVSHGEQAKILEPLPVAALRISPTIVEALQRLAIDTVGDLLRLPRSTLPSRFGSELLLRLHQALGVTWESFTPERLREPLFAQWSADDPLTDQRELACIFRQLLMEILTDLSPRRAGLLDLHCELRTESQTVTMPLGLSQPTTDAKHLIQLFELACERQRLPGGVFDFRLEAIRLGSLNERQTTLLETERESTERDVARLVERLGSRLGEQAVLQPISVADLLPEFSLRLIPWREAESAREEISYVPNVERVVSRPWRLLCTPQSVDVIAAVPDGPPWRLHWQGRTWNVAQSWGPERLETDWWRSRDTQRDYHRIETEEGGQFWLFRRRDTNRWFLHGIFD